MEITRHARNNMRLYKISESDIIEAIESSDVSDREGSKSIAIKKFSGRFSGYPLKVVYESAEEDIYVITTYPLKKKHWR